MPERIVRKRLGVNMHWWEDHGALVSTADWAVDVGELGSAQEVVYFFEKPWCFDDLYEQWRESAE